MKIKKILIFLMVCVCFSCLVPMKASADDIDTLIGNMGGVKEVEAGSTDGRIGKVINAIIKLIQIAGTGVSVIIVTALGIKYMLASSSEKADIKKMATPIIVGCALLFAASNLVAIIASVGDGLNS